MRNRDEVQKKMNERAKIVDEQRKLVDLVEKRGDGFTAEENIKLDKMDADKAELRKDINQIAHERRREEKLAADELEIMSAEDARGDQGTHKEEQSGQETKETAEFRLKAFRKALQ